MSMVPAGRMRRVVTGVVAALLMGTGFVWAAQPGVAVHDTGMFELDGNVGHDAATTPPYDWASLFAADGSRLVTPDADTGPVLASGFVSDLVASDTTYFAGGTKIGDAIHTWSCGGPAANAKTSVNYTYASLIHVPAGAPDNAGHTVLYLGVEKQAGGAGGDNAFGFWLFKNSTVGCSGGGAFTGAHNDGDIFIDGTFTNGGGTSDVEVYRWNGDDATGSIGSSPILTGAVCGVAANDNACAIANAADIPAGAWNASSTNAANTFVEAGIDISQLLGSDVGCFSSFLADSQSSQSTSSQPKDYAAGQFNTCPEPPITTTATPGGSLVAPGTAQHDVAELAAVGGRPTPTGDVTFFLCAPADVTADGCPTGGTQVGSAVALDNGAATSATASGAATTPPGKYCWRAEYTPDADSTGQYLPSSHTNASTECFTVVHGAPTVTTQIAIGGSIPGTVPLTTLGDAATFADVVGTPSQAQSTVTFSLWGPYADGVTPTCDAPLAAERTGTLTATANSGEFTASTSSTFTPTQPGTYVWTAHWGGNALNSAADEACNGANEQTTLAAAGIKITKTANPAGPVSAGSDIGFDIVVSNTGAGTAGTVHVTDDLPAGGDLNWSLDPAYAGCSITGAVGAQTLGCDFATLAGSTALPAIHVQSATSGADCAVVHNEAGVTTLNAGQATAGGSVTVNCPQPTIQKTADAATVSAGSPIGFTVTVTNVDGEGVGTATDVVIDDPLPAGDGVAWTIDAGPPNCAIQGDAPTQLLACSAVDLGPGELETVHVVSGTGFTSCATYDNTATATISNRTGDPLSASDSVDVLCAALTLSKMADADAVNSGKPIGFTIHATNAGPGTAVGAAIADPLPAGPDVSWQIDPAYDGPGTCTIEVVSDIQTLECALGDLGPQSDVTVHVTSATTDVSCGTYDNTAALVAGNAPDLTADASTTVNCAGVLPVSVPPKPTGSGTLPLAETGPGPVRSELGWGVGSLLIGGLLLLLGSRRRRTN
ncbi:MAG: hypothetical protein QOK11_356 [Pseudonocardiales bacterium]|nr:hypothetical protein [Pseudonocardiales bacterium]